MGGNAFNAVGKESQRMDLETFNGVKQDVYNFLTQLGIEYLDIAYIRDKTSFGDLDVLVVENGDGVFNKIKENKDQLGLLDYQYFRNGMVTSILYKDKYQEITAYFDIHLPEVYAQSERYRIVEKLIEDMKRMEMEDALTM